jgi:EAL domain-containing protein (putative c-di-GMP-specific phosphodiesterase class I)
MVQFRYTFEKEFTEAMDKNELELVFQPIVSADTFVICGFEVLTRWEQNTFNLSIGDVISMAEKTDLIITVDRYVVEHTFAMLKNEERFKDLFLSLNLSSRSFRLDTLADYMREQKEVYDINPHRIHLELTEYTLIDDVDISKSIMDDLKEAGYDLSLDDFGTGYSSLNYLNKLPFHTLKFDKSYVDNVLVDKRNYIIVEDIIQLTHKLDMETIAEGVETREQIDTMKSLGCNYFQGYYFSGPLTLEELKTTPNDAFCGKKDVRE